jgi:Nif-specific regulatory protein
MEPKLVAIAGPLKGTTIPLLDMETIIGRDLTNQVTINDPLVSRRHCSIRNQGDEVHLSDLQSLNGTFINDENAQERLLQHGDRIKVGASHFIFLLHDEGEIVPLSDSGSEQLFTTVTMKLDRQETVFFQPDSFAETQAHDARLSRDLAALLRISTAINGIKKAQELQGRVLEMMFEVMPIERGAILLTGPNSDDFASGIYRDVLTKATDSFRISRTIARKVLSDGVALMANDVLNDQQFNPSESLVASQIRSLLCVPLIVFGSKLGIIYADTTRPDTILDEHHLHLLTAIASIVAVALEHVRYVEWLEGENQRLQQEINIQHDMVGDSAGMQDVLRFIGKVSAFESTVMIRGESGTGKELVARAIHRNSRRANRPFVAINCAALTESLVESELFGHERGAFTNAVNQKKGKIEIADGGTLFLDEIGELPLAAQSKLLRVLQEREFDRVGGTKPIQVDIRLIAATNRNLDEAVKANLFRHDLFFRLNVLAVTLPPLRERREDIPLLAKHFVEKYAGEAKRVITPEAYALLKNYYWPGNVRELQNALERAVVLGSSDQIRPEDLPEALLEGHDLNDAVDAVGLRYHEAVNSVKRDLIIRAYRQADGNITEAAKLLDLHPNYLHRLIRNMDLRNDL